MLVSFLTKAKHGKNKINNKETFTVKLSQMANNIGISEPLNDYDCSTKIMPCNFVIAQFEKDGNAIECILKNSERLGLCTSIESFLFPYEIPIASFFDEKRPKHETEMQIADVARETLNVPLIQDLIKIILEYSQPVINVAKEMFIDVQDTVKIWCLAVIKNLFLFNNAIILKIHYLNWGNRYDELIMLDDQRIRFLYNYKNEFIFNWDSIETANFVEYRFRDSNCWVVNLTGVCNLGRYDSAPIGTFLAP